MSEETINTPKEERTTEETIETPQKRTAAKPKVSKEETTDQLAENQAKKASEKKSAAPTTEEAKTPADEKQCAEVETPEAATAAEETSSAKQEVADAAVALVEASIKAAKEIVADVKEGVSQIVETVADAIKEGSEGLQDTSEEVKETLHLSDEYLQNLASKSLKEITEVFQNIIDKADQQEMYKYAEAIKASFYKALKREKIAAGFQAPAGPTIIAEPVVNDADGQASEASDTEKETNEGEASDAEVADEIAGEDGKISVNPFAEIERGFKSLYGRYKSMRAAYLQEMEKRKEENLQAKLQIIEELKALLETQEDLNRTFPAFRALQTRWRESGPIPQNKVKDVYDTYQHYVEMFYDYVKINNELRDLDFKKNLEAKEDLCVKAESLTQEENIVVAFNKLQKLHEEWKNFGPVDKEHRESIWERFRAATSIINKKHQEHFEGLKDVQKDNLVKKTSLCEKAEAISTREIPESNGWNDASKELENLQKEWKTIGFASKKDNQKIYDRFRAACDAFYNRKREYYAQFKDQMTQNMEKKLSLCEKAEALKDSTEWKKATDALIALQKEWKEIGPVSRKKSEQIWSRFRAACDFFFDNKEKNYGGVDPQYVENLTKKRAIIEEVKAFVSDGSRDNDVRAMKDFFNRWNEIGFVPFKEKDKIQEEFKEAIDTHFAEYRSSEGRGRRMERGGRGGDRGLSRQVDPARSEREKLLQKFRKIESEIATYENNMGFFASSKNADAFIKEINKKIDVAKAELKELEEKIKEIDKQFE